VRRSFIAVALALVACAKPAPPAPAEEAPPVVAKAAGPSAHTFTGHMAELSGGLLRECADMSVKVSPPPDAGADWQPKANPLDKFAKDVKRTAIPKPCAEQFADRLALATCTVRSSAPAKTGEAFTVEVATRFYDFGDVGTSDAKMAECLETKGDWSAIPKDSHEWRKARLEHSRKRLEKAADDLAKE
jgi:hypothetical protein